MKAGPVYICTEFADHLFVCHIKIIPHLLFHYDHFTLLILTEKKG